MDLETRLEMLLELDPEALDPGLAERLMDEVLAVFRQHLPVRSLEGILKRQEGHLILLVNLELA
ncbi:MULTISPECIES: hypothetical protein [Thermus]|uniref:Uncharacterized protein n=2 Tax=Thermus scotoductus TaxID=37636 RepID=A0A0N0IQ04_THESC|nr:MULTISPECIES: hypothetical protein [Thermus]ADW20867.1 hypothetical protein TSC_c02270 [Thermus scotoductus SA-01]ETN88403.1 hypothetical protein TNMX_07110 [Thermus sp. NMX2.A1]KPD26865.1 hypothetical protein AN926_09940 [Thermus scotoductus]RTG93704.1 hypothetical protein CSW49_10055 [Thermus scotoductus]RTH07347.1 hypothetical protein CSW45_00470 [Thermus scotoductus]